MQLEDVEKECRKGLTDHEQTWAQFRREIAYYLNEGHRFVPSREAEQAIDKQARPKLGLHITHKVVNELAKGLYAHPGPTRKVANSPEADNLYQAVCKEHRLNKVLHKVDRMTYLHGVCGVQVVPNLDAAKSRKTGTPALKSPDAPVKFRTWTADEFAVWTEDDDPSCPWAVVIKSVVGGKTRLQLWTDEAIQTYYSAGKVILGPTSEDTFYLDPSQSGPNPFGVLPFVFCHNEDNTDGFWTPGLGNTLVNTCFWLDQVLSDSTHAVQTYCMPEKYSRNLSVSSRLVNRPGDPMELIERDPSKDADVFFRQPDLAVPAVWMQIENTVNETLEGLDIPFQIQIQATAQPESGVALIVRKAPLFDKWRIRQDCFKHFECRLARLAARVAAVSTNNETLAVMADTLELDVEFPEYSFPIPSLEKDQSDEWELSHGLTDEVELIKQRYGLTERQAFERLELIAKRREQIAALKPPAEPHSPALQVRSDLNEGEFAEGEGQPVLRGQGSLDGSAAPLESAVPTVYER
jgi:hypothetical protein